MDNKDLTKSGWIAGVIVWFGFLFVMAAKTEYTCPSTILTSVVAIGFIVPAWVAAHLVSGLFPKKKE
jgi:hypothetical protein